MIGLEADTDIDIGNDKMTLIVSNNKEGNVLFLSNFYCNQKSNDDNFEYNVDNNTVRKNLLYHKLMTLYI